MMSARWMSEADHLQRTLARQGLTDRAPEVPALLERDIQGPVIQVLNFHSKVAWAVRVNTGAMKVGDRFVKFMFKGASDIWGQMKDGRLLVVETKRQGENPTEDQQLFLDLVTKHGGVAFVARSVTDVRKALERA